MRACELGVGTPIIGTPSRGIDTPANRMQTDIAQALPEAAQETRKDAGRVLAVGQVRLTEFRNAKSVGRLVFDLNESSQVKPGSEHDIVLMGGDMLVAPGVLREITVIGEVQRATSHLHSPSFERADHAQTSGRLIARGRRSNPCGPRRWYCRGGSRQGGHQARGTVFAPLDAEPMRPLPFLHSRDHDHLQLANIRGR